ncbi:MAG: universal stress protein [Flavobacteriales bacterium]
MKAILATTDFSTSSLNAVNYAAHLAISTNSKLILLHATHIPVVSDSFFDMGFTLEELEKTDKEQMQILNEKLRKKFGPELKLEKQVKIGFTGELIQGLVEEGKVSLVVMGMGHMDKFSEVVFGSTSTAIAGRVSCPVLIIPEKTTFRPIKRIGLAFDQKEIPTGTGLRTIRDVRDAFGSEMHYINVMDNPYVGKDDSNLKPVYKVFGEKQPRLHFLNAVPNQTIQVIQDWARRYKMNAMVMVSRERSILWRMFNERNTKKMAFSTRVPLFVVSETKNH